MPMRLLVFLCFLFFGSGLVLGSEADDHVLKGQAALKGRDIVAAITSFSRALELDPNNDQAAFERGRILLTIGEPQKAISDFTTAILVNPQHGLAFAKRGEAKIVVKDIRSAFVDFDQAILATPKDYEVYVIRATYRLKFQDLTGAKEDLLAARALTNGETAGLIERMINQLP